MKSRDNKGRGKGIQVVYRHSIVQRITRLPFGTDFEAQEQSNLPLLFQGVSDVAVTGINDCLTKLASHHD